MKKIKAAIWILNLTFCTLFADDFNYDNDSEWENHPYKDSLEFPMHFNNYQAHKRRKEFAAELEWHKETTLKEEIHGYQSELATNNLSEDERETLQTLLERAEARYNIRRQSLDTLKNSLSDFLQNTVECIYCNQCDPINPVDRYHGYYAESVVNKEITLLLTQYLENELLPPNWKENYRNHKESKQKGFE